MAIGLYRDTWDRIEFLVAGYPKAKYKKVRNEKEGVSFIKAYHRAKGLGRPPCFKEGRHLYPRVSKIRRCLGMHQSTSDDYSSSDGSSSDSDITFSPPSKSSASKGKKIGVDPSLGKENEIFGVGLKNVNVLEAGVAPPNLGKKTISIFLEQIDDMTAYPRHVNHKNSEGLGEFVDAVADLNNQRDGRKGGSRDTGWRNKTRNALEYIKSSDGLNSAISYVLEEQHNILETCQGDLESILINAHMEEEDATYVATNSLAMRISRDTLHSYVSLLNHLAGVANIRGWEACASQLKYHSDKLGLIRGKYRHRIQMVCRIYTYLRDGQHKNWMSLKIQENEITSLRSQMVQGDGAGQGYACSHCKSGLHGGGRTSCPWVNKSSSEAKKAANAFMLRMSDGTVTAATP